MFKILSLLLCCAVQGENVSECIDNITSLEEKLQFQLKIIIEAVLKDLDNGKIDPVNLTDVLCQSGNLTCFQITIAMFRRIQVEEFKSILTIIESIAVTI